MLKEGVLDPQGKAIAGALSRLGFAEAEVRAGKLFRIELPAASAEEARQKGRRMAETLLANPVIEDFEVEVVPA